LIILLKNRCYILLMTFHSVAYPLMFSLGNVDELPCGELPKHYQGDQYWQYCYKEESWFDDSNIFDNPFVDVDDECEWDDEIKPLKRSNSYDILEIDEDADENEIKKAFRKKALETHPDKTGGDDELFKKVREAYETIMKYFKSS